MTTGEVIKNELKVVVPLGVLYKKPSSNDKISYTIVSLINHDGDSLHCGHYVSDVFDTNTGIWCHCDDETVTQISDLPKGVILERVTKKSDVRLNICIICCSYHNNPSDQTQLYLFSRIYQHVQNQSYEEIN